MKRAEVGDGGVSQSKHCMKLQEKPDLGASV